MSNFGICNTFDQRAWVQDQWQFVLSNFGVTEFWTRNTPDNHEKEFLDPTRINHASELPSDRPLVLLAHPEGTYYKGEESLLTFNHPDNAIYMFGADNRVISEDDMGGRVPDHLVYVPSGKHEMYSWVVASLVMYDRMVKGL